MKKITTIIVSVILFLIINDAAMSQSVNTFHKNGTVINSTSSFTINGDYTVLTNPANNTYARAYYGTSALNLFTSAQFLPVGDGTFSITITGLTPGQKYYYRSKITYPFTFDDVLDSITMPTCPYSVNLTPITDTICVGGTVLLSAGVTGAISPTYVWTPSTGLNSSTISNPTATPATTTTYTVKVTDGGCSETNSLVITVLPATNVTATGAATICSGSSTIIHASGIGVTEWTWSPATGLNDENLQNPTASPTTTTTYNVVGVNAGGCSSSASVTVNVSGSITANAGSDQNICSGSSVNFNATGGTSYHWSPSTGLSNISIANPVANPTATTTYVVTVVNGACSATDNLTVTVAPSMNFNVGSDQEMCAGNSATLSASASGGVNFTWSPAGSLNDPNLPNPTATPTSTTTYTVVADNGTCTASESVVVTINSNPNAIYATHTGGILIIHGTGFSNVSQIIVYPGGISYVPYYKKDTICKFSVASYSGSDIVIQTVSGCETDFPFSITTGIDEYSSVNEGKDLITYNLLGQPVDSKNLTPGVYIKGGKKFVVTQNYSR